MLHLTRVYFKDINFCGSTYITYFAIPHLRKSKGKVIVITSGAETIALPVASVYSVRSYLGLNNYVLLTLLDLLLQASKAALLRFFETLRIELNPDIKITIVFPGVVATDMTTPRCIEHVSNKVYIFTPYKY